MATDFPERLGHYYREIAKVLRGQASAASIFPNPSDIGSSRESVYADFLKQHAPSKCNVFFGGYVFDEFGDESRQLDVIVTTDVAPQFNFLNKDGKGKSFAHVEGTLAVASIKSTLDRNQLFDALLGFASIPLVSSLDDGRLVPGVKLKGYEDWPLKILYASDGISGETLWGHLMDFYERHPKIPFHRRPNYIHVAGKYLQFRATDEMKLGPRTFGEGGPTDLNIGTFYSQENDPDVQAIAWILYELHHRAVASSQILYRFGPLINVALGRPDKRS